MSLLKNQHNNTLCECCRVPVTDGIYVVHSHGLYLDDDLSEHVVCTMCERSGLVPDDYELSNTYTFLPNDLKA